MCPWHTRKTNKQTRNAFWICKLFCSHFLSLGLLPSPPFVDHLLCAFLPEMRPPSIPCLCYLQPGAMGTTQTDLTDPWASRSTQTLWRDMVNTSLTVRGQSEPPLVHPMSYENLKRHSLLPLDVLLAWRKEVGLDFSPYSTCCPDTLEQKTKYMWDTWDNPRNNNKNVLM